MQPAKRQRLETSFSPVPYLFLNLNCSRQLVGALVTACPALFIPSMINCIVLDLVDDFEKQLKSLCDFPIEQCRFYQMAGHCVEIRPITCKKHFGTRISYLYNGLVEFTWNCGTGQLPKLCSFLQTELSRGLYIEFARRK